MFPYLPHTSEERQQMLERIGVESVDGLFTDIPESIRLNRGLNLNHPCSEMEIKRICRELSGQNATTDEYACFIGAGYYDHYIPSVIDQMLLRSEFYTAYTPYQAERSQGYLQAIFEYQTMICELTGMDISNASMYDGATAAVEAGFICLNAKRKQKTVLVAGTVHPEVRRVMKTYFAQSAQTLVEVGTRDGLLDLADLEAKLTPDVAGIVCQYPNFFGNIEDLKTVAEKVHANGSVMVVSADPIALGLLESPAALGADIVVGEGQALGNEMSYGGPALGFMAVKEDFVRFIPGRVVGQTTDAEGNRGFVLTLQAREQHIRREKALSNICSNEALNALAALIYLTVMGKKGLRQVAADSFKRAHYLMEQIKKVPGFSIKFTAPFFKEFVVETERDVDQVLKALLDAKILGGYALKNVDPALGNCFMVAVTEKRTKAEIDKFVQVLEGVK